MSDSDACEVPFCEQLRDVPREFRASREIQWAEDGTPTGHQFIPVGFMFHRAADALDAQAARIKELEGALRVAIKHWEEWCDQNNGSLPDNVMGGESDDYARAREALK